MGLQFANNDFLLLPLLGQLPLQPLDPRVVLNEFMLPVDHLLLQLFVPLGKVRLVVLSFFRLLQLAAKVFLHGILSLPESFGAGDIALSKFIAFGLVSLSLLLSYFKLIVEIVMLNPYLNIFLLAFTVESLQHLMLFFQCSVLCSELLEFIFKGVSRAF